MVIIIISICIDGLSGKVYRGIRKQASPGLLNGLTLNKCIRTPRRGSTTPFGLFNRTTARKR
ncbi:hypothetical protein EcCFBP13530_02675 [Enterobacter cancerogenus]|uniref:Uncharacterized protein n=1 Tax=Enterobacter cancerogenus TaxID=69218 RepID=A0AB38PA42_9ENTR|nr:hypothetical protein CWI88_15305 [Enterobacter cancerogenus]TKK23784.1 hypothetical protein EcCFBP13530_02675 [Enterobacter cancerogenus]